MAVHDSKQVLDDNSEEDDAPLVFRRSSTASKQNQLSSGAKKASFRKYDGSLSTSASDQSGKTSNPQRNKNSTAKVLSKKPSAVTSDSLAPKPEQSKHSLELGKASGDMGTTHLSSPCNEVKNSDDSDDDRPLSSRRRTSSVPVQTMNSQKVNKQPSIDNLESKCTNDIILDKSCARTEHSDDSDDDKPLSSKFSTAPVVNKSSPLNAMKVLEASRPTSSLSRRIKTDTKNYLDDSDDEKPLVSRFQSRSGVAKLKNSADSNKEKPLTSKAEQNDSTKRDSRNEIKLVKVSTKRALDEGSNSMKSETKKARVSDASVSVKAKHGPVVKKEVKTDDNDHIPISQRFKKVSLGKQASTKNVMKKTIEKVHRKTKKIMKNSKYSKSLKVPPESGGAQKWTTLQHNGVIFPAPYKSHGIKMLYNGQPVDLTPEQEEVATMFAVMKDTDYATKPKFIENFMNDWRQILGKNHVIKKFELCDFTPIYEWHLIEKEKKKQMSAEEKKALKEEKLKQEEKYMWAIVDGVKEKVGNFRVEPPGLFRGRGEHPKMGKLKRRIHPRDITINIGKGSPIPECPIPGERWKEVKHDNTVTWLAFWTDPINPKEFKYVFLAASSSLKGQSDKEKYEKARLLKDYIHNIRANYTKDFTSKDATKRQIAVATYLIDKLALRAGNEKDDDEADTVGCCTLKVENVLLVPPNKLQFDFLGKDSVRYFNTVEVELLVYKAIGEFQTARKHNGEKKGDGDDLFDMLDTNKLNAHLKELMPGLTAKVFRTYNASITLDEMLSRETKNDALPEKIAVYQHANKEVAIICNHQRSVSKSHDAQMSRLNEKIDDLKAQREEFKVDLSRSRKGKPPLKDSEGKPKRNLSPEALEKKLAQIDAKIDKMELDKKIKEDLKTVALGTSKINYLDPRITVAWCKRHEVPIEKIFNKSLIAKFSWAMDVDPGYRF